MNKILQSTERGQITLPKKWRDKYDTQYYSAHIKDGEITIKPLLEAKTLQDKVEESWKEYKNGDFLEGEKLIEKYGL